MSTTTGLRLSGLPSTRVLPWGSHFCVFSASPQELLMLLEPFVRTGLEGNECCRWEVSAPLTVEEAERALSENVPDLAARLAAGQLEIVAEPASSEAPPPDEVERRLDKAILAGFDGLRLVCPASSVGGAEKIQNQNVIAAFLHPRAELDAVGLMRVVQDYPFALVCNTGRWELLEGSEASTARDALRRSEEKLQSLFGNMSEGFAYHRIVLDAQGEPCDYVFLEINPAFERLTGLVAFQVLGKRVTQVLPGIEKDPTDWIGRYGRVALLGEPMQFESQAAALDRWYSVSAFSPHKGYFAVTFSDITARKRAEAERLAAETRLQALARDLQSANTALVDVDRRKNEFLAMLSHELRNPLAPIRNSLYVLEHAAPGGNQARRAQEVIDRQVDHLTRLVGDLLDVTRVSRNKIRLQRTRMDLCDVVRRSVEDQRSLFERGALRLETAIPAQALFIDGDPTRVAQVVGNLLQNAAKFTPRGGTTSVSVTEDRDRRGGQAVVRVKDSGAGMTAETLAGLFQPFMQAEKTLDRSKGGLGLGLALVKGLVELHGGEVSAHSEGVGKGAEFVVRLPIDDAAQAGSLARSASPAPQPRRVLIVEDGADAADSLREALALAGHDVSVASDGPEAIALAREIEPEVVLCDIGLPGMNGYELARAFRADAVLRGAYLVALSGYALPEDLRRSQEAGFDDHMAKPPDLPQLARLLETLARRQDWHR